MVSTGVKIFRPDIEGLRALAVAGVVAFHFGATQLSGGFAGVDIFFVISGYLITQHLMREIDERGTINLLAFYARRARRLLPASLFVILATLLFGYFILAPSEQNLYSKGALYASAYAINVWLLRWSFDYFAPDAASNPFLHFWSLSAEEQFYLFWPALLLLFARFRPRRRGMLLLLALVGAISFAACARLTFVSQPWAFYFVPLRAWEFAAGGLASFAILQQWAQRSRFPPALGWIGLILIASTYLLASEDDPFPGFIALAPVLGTVMLLLGGAYREPVGPKAVLAHPVLQWVGKLSYSLYLWHWPVIAYAAILNPDLTIPDRLLCLAFTIGLSILSYHLIENPVRHSRWLMARSSRPLALAAILTGLGVTLAYASASLAKLNVDDRQRYIQRSAARKSVARNTDGCIAEAEVDQPFACELTAASSGNTVVLFGDSHADHWSSPLVEIARKKGWRLVGFLKDGCPPARVRVWSANLKREFDECERWREAAIKQIIALKPVLIIVSEFSQHYAENHVETVFYNPVDLDTWVAGLKSTLEELRLAGGDVLVLRDTPLRKTDLYRCVARALWRGMGTSVCDTPRADALDDEMFNAEKAMVSGIHRVYYIDTSGMFCSDASCPAVVNDKLVYRDRQHMAVPFSEWLAPQLKQAIFGGAAKVQILSSPSSASTAETGMQ